MKKIDPIESAPDALKDVAKKVNELVAVSLPLKAGKGIKIAESKEDRMISVGDGGALPTGYGPEEFTICDSGSPVTRNFITDNPD